MTLLPNFSPVDFSGSEAAAVGLHPGQCILKVNGNNATHGNYLDVLEHFTAYRARQQEALVGIEIHKGSTFILAFLHLSLLCFSAL